MEVHTGRPARWFARLVTSPLRYAIIVAWIGLAVVAYFNHVNFNAGAESVALLAPKNAAAIRVQERAFKLFGLPLISHTVIVQRNPHGLSPAAQARVIDRALAIDAHHLHDLPGPVGALPVINTLGIFPASHEVSTTALTYLYFKPSLSVRDRDRVAETLERRYINHKGDALVGATGVVPARARQGDLIARSLHSVEAATVVLIVLIVGFTFRSLIAPLITLLAAGVAYLGASWAVSYLAAQSHIATPIELKPLLVVLVLAVCTDYAIFFLSGTREALAAGNKRVAAARLATAEFVPIIFIAGLTVAACTACLLLARLAFLRALGPALALSVAVALVVAITLVPACLAVTGRATFWPGVRSPSSPEAQIARLRRQLSHWTSNRLAALGIALLVLVGLAAVITGVRQMRLGTGLLNGLPQHLPAARAYVAAGRGFAPGVISPTLVLLQEPRLMRQQSKLARLEGLMAQQPGVAGIIGPREQPVHRAFGVVFSHSGNAARMAVILRHDPYSAAGIADLVQLERAMPALVRTAGLQRLQVGFGGDTALAQATINHIEASILPVGLAIGVVIVVLLAVLLRSLVAPWYLLAASTLAVAAPLGLTTYLFQVFQGYPGIAYYVPIGVGVLLIALGSDYNLFLAGRIWEEARGRSLRGAVAIAGREATRAITAAAITLAASFALLAIIPLTPLREFAFAMAAGVLIDSFLVRSYLVPALIVLVGKLSLWPNMPQTIRRHYGKPG